MSAVGMPKKVQLGSSQKSGACSFSESAWHVVTCFAVAGGLKKAGDSFVSLSKLSDPPSDSSFQSAGDALVQAHASWTVDWTEVTMALADAVTSISRMSDQFSESNSAAADLHQEILLEREVASNISGCMSIGPPSSAPNLEASELEDEDVHSPIFWKRSRMSQDWSSRLIHWFIDSLIHWFIDSLIHWFIDSSSHIISICCLTCSVAFVVAASFHHVPDLIFDRRRTREVRLKKKPLDDQPELWHARTGPAAVQASCAHHPKGSSSCLATNLQNRFQLQGDETVILSSLRFQCRRGNSSLQDLKQAQDLGQVLDEGHERIVQFPNQLHKAAAVPRDAMPRLVGWKHLHVMRMFRCVPWSFVGCKTCLVGTKQN
jgi:hypothetical protein